MERETMSEATEPQIPASAKRTINELLAARVDSAAAMVEPGQLISGYCSEDPMSRNRLVQDVEKAFNVSIDATAFDRIGTVRELYALVARSVAERKTRKKGRRYIVVYRNAEGGVAERHVFATNHKDAVESLRAEGLVEVITVAREEDEDLEDTGRSSRSTWGVGVFLFLLALAAAAALFGYYYLQRR